MLIALLQTKDTPRALHILERFGEGVRRSGDDTVWVKDKDDLHRVDRADVAVQICVANKHHDGTPVALFRLEAARRLSAAGKRVVTVDTGFLKSQPEAEVEGNPLALSRVFDPGDPSTFGKYDDRIYYSVGYDGIKGGADYCTTGAPADRWEALGVKLRPWRKAGAHVVVVGQTYQGLSSQHVDVYAWYKKVMLGVRNRSGRSVVFRPHPRIGKSHPARRGRDRDRMKKLLKEVGGVKVSTSPHLADDLRGAWAVVCLTSNAAVWAAVRGVPVVTADRACFAYPVAEHDLAKINAPATPDREGWTHRLSYSQWTVDEMRQGLPWQHLKPHAEKGRK